MKKLLLAAGLLFVSRETWAAARGSGSYTPYTMGVSSDALYLPAAREEPGWATASTQSYNNDLLIISSAINQLRTLPFTTNYLAIADWLPQRAGHASGSNTLQITSATTITSTSTALRYDTSGNFGVGGNEPVGSIHINKFDTGGTLPAASFHLSTGAGNSGLWVQSMGLSSAAIAIGARWNGSNWIAEAPESSIFELRGSTISFYHNLGLTAGSSFTPANASSVSSNGFGTGIFFMPPFRFGYPPASNTLTISSANNIIAGVSGFRLSDSGNFSLGTSTDDASISINRVDQNGSVAVGASIHVSTGVGTQGTWLQNTGMSSATLAGGAYWNGGSWIAAAASASIVEVAGTSVAIYFNTGLTRGTSFTPSRAGIFQLDNVTGRSFMSIGSSLPRGNLRLGNGTTLDDDGTNNRSVLLSNGYSDGTNTYYLDGTNLPVATYLDNNGWRLFTSSLTGTANTASANFATRVHFLRNDGSAGFGDGAAPGLDQLRIGRWAFIGSTRTTEAAFKFNLYSDGVSQYFALANQRADKIVLDSSGIGFYVTATQATSDNQAMAGLSEKVRLMNTGVLCVNGTGCAAYNALEAIGIGSFSSDLYSSGTLTGNYVRSVASTTLFDLHETTRVSIGVSRDPTTRALLNINGNALAGATPTWNIHGSTGPGRQGGWLQGTVSDDLALSAGAFYDGSNWRASGDNGGSSILTLQASSATFFLNNQLTKGNTFTSTQRWQLTPAGMGIGTQSPPRSALNISSGTLYIDGNTADSIYTSGNVCVSCTAPGTINSTALTGKFLQITNGAGTAEVVSDGVGRGGLLLNASGSSANARVFQLRSENVSNGTDNGEFQLISWNDNETQRSTILTAMPGGNVAVGATTAASKLTVSGGIAPGSSAGLDNSVTPGQEGEIRYDSTLKRICVSTGTTSTSWTLMAGTACR